MPMTDTRRPARSSSSLSLTATLFLTLLSFTVVALLVFGGLLLLFYIQTQQSLIFNNQHALAQRAAETVSGYIREKINIMSAVLRLDSPLNLTPEKKRFHLEGLLGVEPSFRSLCFLDRQRNITAFVSRLTAPSLESFHARLDRISFFKERPAGHYISPVYFDQLTGEPFIILAVTSTDLLKEFNGYLAAEFNLKFMWETVDRFNLKAKGESYVVDKEGNLIAFGDPSRVLRVENVAHIKTVGDFITRSSADIEGKAAVYQGISGERVVGAYVPLGTPDWAAVVEVPWDKAFRPVTGTLLISLVVFLFFSLLAGALGILIARRLAAPLVRLTETAGLIADGESLVPVKVRGPIEVERLASAFNSMVSRLLKTSADLEAQLVEIKSVQEERAKLEQKLFQAQKMESIGRLAGGVAHDFNNMLNVILGYAELIRLDTPPRDQLLAEIAEIERAAGQARDITRQLLAFSRKQIISPVSLDINEIIKENREMLSRLIGEDIDLRFIPDDNLWPVTLDPSQLSQIVYNLAINARDAMPNGGRLTIETANIILDETYCREHMGFNPGHYVRLTVSDSGVGMDRETMSHLFEPFFTTKDVGKGTGLGLATIYGIVKQNGGFINVYSEPGRGSSFHIYFLKEKNAGTEAVPSRSEEPMMLQGGETILLVEDDEMVRSITTAELTKLGYRVVSLKTPEEALAACVKDDTPYALLITDVIMPGMNGIELRDALSARRPGIKVLFMSGYTANTIVHHGVLDRNVHFLQKPFSLKDLAQKVRQAIEE